MLHRVHFATFLDPLAYAPTLLARQAVDAGLEVSNACYPDGVDEQTVARHLEEDRPDLVATSFMLFSRDDAFTVAKVARRLGIPVVAGGTHATTCPEDLQASGLFDGIVVGDGLGLFPQILSNPQDLKGQVLKGRAHPDPEIWFRRHLLPHQRQRLAEGGTIDLFTSVGCPFHCAFCSKTRERPLLLPLEPAVDYLARAREEHGIQRAEIWDEIFAMNPARLARFRDLLARQGLGLRFTSFAHAALFNDEIAALLAEIGVDDLWFGLETASPRLLRFLEKGFTVEQAEAAAHCCRRHGLPFKVYAMAGLPTQTHEDYEVTLGFLQRTRPEDVSVTFFMPFPGSPLLRFCIEQGHMPPGWSFDHYLEGPPVKDHPGVRTYGGLRGVDYRAAVDFQQAVLAWQADGRLPGPTSP